MQEAVDRLDGWLGGGGGGGGGLSKAAPHSTVRYTFV